MPVQFDSCASSYDTYLHLVTVDPWMKTMNSCDDQLWHTHSARRRARGPTVLLVHRGYDTQEGDYPVTMNCPSTAIGFLDGAISCGQTVRVTSSVKAPVLAMVPPPHTGSPPPQPVLALPSTLRVCV